MRLRRRAGAHILLVVIASGEGLWTCARPSPGCAIRRALSGDLLIAAAFLDGEPRATLWALAVLLDFGGLVVRAPRGGELGSGHFAERHGLIIIIALGESIVAIGVGAGGERGRRS